LNDIRRIGTKHLRFREYSWEIIKEEVYDMCISRQIHKMIGEKVKCLQKIYENKSKNGKRE